MILAMVKFVALTGAGWTDFPVNVGTTEVWCSSLNGDDSNDGLSEATPKATLAAVYGLIGNGDYHVNLERGSAWSEQLGGSSWDYSGSSATERIVVKPYGDETAARPIIEPGITLDGFFANNNEPTAPIRHVALVGLHFRTCLDGIDIHTCEDILIEDCLIEGADANGINIRIGGSLVNVVDDVTIRRCIVRDCDGQGIFAGETNDLLIEGCVLYNNGLDDTTFNHNMYLGWSTDPFERNATNTIVRNCWFLNAGGNYGFKCNTQTNLQFYHNVLASNRNGMDVENHDETQQMTADIWGNLLIDLGNPSAQTEVRGVDIAGATVNLRDNIILRSAPLTTGNPCIHYQMQVNYAGEVGGNWTPSSGVVERNVIYGWDGIMVNYGIRSPGLLPLSNITIQDNDFQNVSPNHPTGVDAHILRHEEPPTFGGSGVTYARNRYWSSHDVNAWFNLATVDDTPAPPNDRSYTDWVTDSGETGSSNTQVTYPDTSLDLGDFASLVGQGGTQASLTTALLAQRRYAWVYRLDARRAVNYIRSAAFGLGGI